MALMFSVSGLRGIAYKDLTFDNICFYAQAFAKFLNAKTIVLGRDTRKSGDMVGEATREGLNLADCDVISLGIVPTPTVVFMVHKLKADGGIVVTASHNPVEWNGLKFINNQARFLNEKEFLSFVKFIENYKPVSHEEKYFPFYTGGRCLIRKDPLKEHLKKIISSLKLKNLELKIGVDAVNGAGSEALPRLLESAGCKVYRLNCEFKSTFPRGPEPIPENIGNLCQLVKEERLDLGFALDPDGDRLSIVDDNGEPIGEENTLVLATDYILSKRKGNVVTNLSTTALMDYVTKKYNCRLSRTKVGEANVVEKMNRVKAVIGGEGNGGVIYPEINMTRDALTGAGIILKLLTVRKQRISEIISSYPKYFMIKKKIALSKEIFEKKKSKILQVLKGRVNLTDGLRITAKDYWLHVRPSNTEPLVRIIGEGKNPEEITAKIKKAEKILQGDA